MSHFLMQFRKYPLFYILAPLSVLAIALSFYRFMVVGDYTVAYEGECNAATESCFVGCADEECLEIYHYTLVEKSAGDVHAQCGPDISDCADASICLSTDSNCSVTFCSPTTALSGEVCETLNTTSPQETGGMGDESSENQIEEAEL